MTNEEILRKLTPSQKTEAEKHLRDGWNIVSYDGRYLKIRKGYGYKIVHPNGSSNYI